jgi:hypothetical protein
VRTDAELVAALDGEAEPPLGLRRSAEASAKAEAPQARRRPPQGPAVIIAKVSESTPTVKPPLDYVAIKERFMAALGGR